jgi:ABC-type branched-subunit amino acid transport system ATPase component
MTVLENVLLGQHRHGRGTLFGALAFTPVFRTEERAFREHGRALLERFDLADVANTVAGTLPYGDQRRLEIARALASDPTLLLLDEPTAGMNPHETHAIGEQILQLRADGLTVLVIEHDMSLIGQVCDAVYVLSFGKVIAHGTTEMVKRDPAVIEAYLGREETAQ